MVTFKDADGLSSAPSDDQVIRTQIESLMEIIIGQVQVTNTYRIAVSFFR